MSNFIYYENLEDYEEQVKKAKLCDEKDKEIEKLKEMKLHTEKYASEMEDKYILEKNKNDEAIEYCKELMLFKKNSRQYLIGKCMLEKLGGAVEEIKITSSGIKQAIDDLVNENELLQDKVYKQEDKIEELRSLYESEREVKEDYKSIIYKAIAIIKQNCILSDKWKERPWGSCNFIPIGHISFTSLDKKGVKELLDILQEIDKW